MLENNGGWKIGAVPIWDVSAGFGLAAQGVNHSVNEQGENRSKGANPGLFTPSYRRSGLAGHKSASAPAKRMLNASKAVHQCC